jgi:hypothetical protein
MAIKNEILDELLKDKDPKTMFSSEGLLGELKKALAERVLKAEMDTPSGLELKDSNFIYPRFYPLEVWLGANRSERRRTTS